MAHKFWALIILAVIITPLGSASISASTPTSNGSSAGPNLTIEAITWFPASPSAGTKMYFSVTIRNRGSERAESSEVDCYIGENRVTTARVGPVGANARLSMTFTWKAQAGDHTVRAVADSGESIMESNEADNALAVAFTVFAPDLIVDEITWSPENASVQKNVTFTVTIKNQGNSTARYSQVEFYIDGVSRGYQGVPMLEAGATVSKTFHWITQAGPHEIKAVADTLNKATESDESNNTRTVGFATLDPDLVVQEITQSPSPAVDGEAITFTVIIKNQGAGKSYVSQVVYYIDDEYLASDYLGQLGAGGTATTTFAWVADKDAHTVRVIADADENNIESDETNNAKTLSLPALAPDLIVASITCSPSNPLIKQSVTFTVTIKNQGYTEAGPFRVYFDIDSWRHYVSIGALGADATQAVTFPWAAQAGSHAIKATVDAESNVVESNEANNTMTTTVSPSPPVPSDLVIQDIAWSPENPVAGELVTFTMTVKNQGDGHAEWSSVAAYIDDILLDSSLFTSLSPGATAPVEFSWESQAGIHTIKAVADSNEILAEENENNNARTANLSVLAADLRVKSITWTPDNPSPGDTATSTITINNSGNCKAGHSSLGYFINDHPQGNHYVEELEAGAEVTRTFTWVVPEGPYIINAVADVEDDVIEQDETNNVKSITFPLPDLSVEAITWSPEEPAENDPVTFDVTIINRSGSAVPDFHVNLHIGDSCQSLYAEEELAAGAEGTITSTWNAQIGSHFIKAVVDEADDIIESDEYNNGKTATISVSEPPPPLPASSPLPAPSAPGTPQYPGQVTHSSGGDEPATGPTVPSRPFIIGAGDGETVKPSLNPLIGEKTWLIWLLLGGFIFGAVNVGVIFLLIIRKEIPSLTGHRHAK